ncbi:hypothetical protein HOO65_050511 [Ceratocystis lukuohia]|uniref:EKC/KEOPS complex subunit BUD32 n=1 Tax=Ceratocystis lukuohia TaxID=2019550 RepID=A0ABR4MGK9_9PEZI
MLNQEILNNIDGHIHGPTSGFIKKYFNKFQYVHQNASLEIQEAGTVISRYAIPSAAPLPENFLQWFSTYVSQEIDGARGSWGVSSDNESSEHKNANDSARFLLNMSTSPPLDNQIKWNHVQAIGQFYQHSDVSYQYGLLRLCQSAHQVFASQPTRFFLHGFYIRGSLIEFWIFDRSGLYCGHVLDIRDDFVPFLSIILNYQRMTDQDLGNVITIEADEGGDYILLDNITAFSLGKLYIDSRPIASDEGLVGPGTTCYRAKVPDSDRWNYVLKFKWHLANDRPEDQLLRLTKEKSVWGAVSLDYYKEVESTKSLRQGLQWGAHRKFIKMDPRESCDNFGKRQQEVTCNADGLIECTEETKNLFQNRILACIVTSPLGRPLHTFQSLTELLQVFRDAIKCHRSLHNDAKILHQDISPGNIIIVDGQDEGKPKGILIDLDSSIDLTEESGTERRIIGTKPFMAIGVLKAEDHTYRHDLESFLYVFLWTIITNRMENPPKTSKSTMEQWQLEGISGVQDS